jgi:hypothetical protein
MWTARYEKLAGVRGMRLVVPRAIAETSAYGHLAAFVRLAPEEQRDALWQSVGKAMTSRVETKPVWLSTAGAGVSWLHVRPATRWSFGMKLRRRVFWATVLVLYAVTWVGGWITHARDIQASAEARYARAQERFSEMMAEEPPGSETPIFLRLREGGPATGVDWCVPLLPGVLLADSYQVLGPLNARGGIQIVLYYGVDSMVLCHITLWLA